MEKRDGFYGSTSRVINLAKSILVAGKHCAIDPCDLREAILLAQGMIITMMPADKRAAECKMIGEQLPEIVAQLDMEPSGEEKARFTKDSNLTGAAERLLRMVIDSIAEAEAREAPAKKGPLEATALEIGIDLEAMPPSLLAALRERDQELLAEQGAS
jgi:hypothetical protein